METNFHVLKSIKIWKEECS